MLRASAGMAGLRMLSPLVGWLPADLAVWKAPAVADRQSRGKFTTRPKEGVVAVVVQFTTDRPPSRSLARSNRSVECKARSRSSSCGASRSVVRLNAMPTRCQTSRTVISRVCSGRSTGRPTAEHPLRRVRRPRSCCRGRAARATSRRDVSALHIRLLTVQLVIESTSLSQRIDLHWSHTVDEPQHCRRRGDRGGRRPIGANREPAS